VTLVRREGIAGPRSAVALLGMLCACRFDLPDPIAPADASDDDGDLPRCTDGDDDNDGVCNAVDKCPDQADGGDVDSDGIVDGCDDWPCGATKPDDPGTLVADSSAGREWGANSIDIGTARRVAAAPGAQFRAKFTWGLAVDCGAGGTCRAQVEFGYGLTRLGCIFDASVNDDQLRVGNFDGQITAPSAPGTYELRLNAGRSASCGTSQAWYSGDPGSDSTIAILCVR
jgi:hypothetical protein